MKTNYFFSIAFAILTCGALSSCNEPKTTEEQTKSLEVPSHLISVAQSVTMKKEYEENIASLIKKSKMDGKYQPTQFAYIELDSLKKYIAFLDQVGKLNNKKISGIRIYYGAYPEIGSKNIEHAGRETFFFAPTIKQNAPGKMTEEQKKYNYLQNVPFSIAAKDAKNKFIGDFTPINELLFSKDVRVNIETASLENSTQKASSKQSLNENANTSVILNELNICPPPAQ